MRLIDADAVEDVAAAFNERAQKENGIPLTRYEFKRLSNVIFEFPTIDPVKHGKWGLHEYPDGYYHTECSECGAVYDEMVYFSKKAHYCPNCGAKNGGEDDGPV